MEHHDHMAHGAHDHAGHNMGHPTTVMPDHSGHDHSGHDNTGSPESGMSHGGGHSMMSMFFHFGYMETVLFESWKIGTIGGLIGSMIGIFFLAALYEGLKYYREFLFWKTYNSLQYRAVTLPGEKNPSEDNQIVQPSMMSAMHFFQTFLHMVQMVVSYFLMLIFMTYNVWLCVAVVLGAATGYFLFGWKKSVIVDVTEHCH